MEKTYKIEAIEVKTTSTGKKKADVTLSANGTSVVATIWGDFPDFETLTFGSQVTGILKDPSDPKYKPSLNAPRKTTGNSNFKEKLMEKAMDKKNEAITHFQGNKELSIKVSSTFRAAYETALVDYQEQRRLSPSTASIEQLFEKWREFYWMHFDVNEGEQYNPF